MLIKKYILISYFLNFYRVNENIRPVDPDQSWTEVLSGETATFKFGTRGKQRHRDSHKLRLHQLGVRIDEWNSINPVCVDKVGVFFRQITHTVSLNFLILFIQYEY